jgi:membrane protease YdiL (CAAX protease family)
VNATVPRLPQAAASFGPKLRGGDVLRAILLGLALFGLGFLLLRELAAGIATPGARINYLLAYFAAWAFAWLAAIWIVFVRRRGLTLAALGYTAPAPVWAVRGVAAAFAALPAAYMLQALLQPVLGTKSAMNLQQYFGGADFTVVHAAAVLLYGGFLVPLAEELLFRGLLFRWLRQRLDFWAAAGISAAAFGIAHQRPDQMVIAGLLGLPMAWLYEKSRSLAPAILMHQTYNSLVLMLTFAVVWLPPATEG